MRIPLRHLCLVAAFMLLGGSSPAAAQRLLVIPNLSKAVPPQDWAEVRRNHLAEAVQELRAKADSDEPAARIQAGARDSAAARTRRDSVQFFSPWARADLLGAMDSTTSKQFWGEARRGILPGASLGVGTGSAAMYTEIGHVLSGTWRFAVGSTLSVATEEEAQPAAQDAAETGSSDALNRFIAGGGSLSLQGLRPVWIFQWWNLNRAAVIAAPRAWVNIPTLASADGINDYGWEMGVAGVFQRHTNNGDPFLTTELRAGWVAGSEAFYAGLGRSDAKSFLYFAPSVTLSIADQVDIGVSTFLNSDFKTPTLRLNLSLLNKKGD